MTNSTPGFTALLLAWYEQHGRKSLPWQANRNPYAIWISEIMLQQTQVVSVIPYFQKFMARFPTLDSLADAQLDEVLHLWSGLGYYARARNLHKAAAYLHERKEKIPGHFNDLMTLPGLGEYTAAAIASIAFGQQVPAVDGNSVRVFTRFWGIKEDSRKQTVRKSIFERLKSIISSVDPSRFNQSVMELGALVCRPKDPQCVVCPLRKNCYAFEKNLTHCLPLRSKKKPVPTYEYGAAVIWDDNGKVLISRRKNNGMLGGLWQFPGGRQNVVRQSEVAIYDLVKQTVSVNFTVISEYCQVKHAYSHFKILLTAYKCELYSKRDRVAAAVDDEQVSKWIKFSDINQYPFDKASLKVIDVINASEILT
jgi:A/G-specific adenine glycosylase